MIREYMKKIKGYEDYSITMSGSVWSNKSNKFLKPNICNRGYCYVSLRSNNKTKVLSIHRLVALAFIPNPENKRTVNHIDGNKSNNNVSNLEWNTYSENSKHSISVLGNPSPPSWEGKKSYEHNKSKEVHLYNSISGNYVNSFGSASAAARKLNCHVSTITLAIKNKTKTRLGLLFSYEKNCNFELI